MMRSMSLSKEKRRKMRVVSYALKTQGIITGGGSSNFRSNGLITLTNFYPKKNELFSKLVLEITTKCVLNHLLRICRNGGCADRSQGLRMQKRGRAEVGLPRPSKWSVVRHLQDREEIEIHEVNKTKCVQM
jgi:hypothetical protein